MALTKRFKERVIVNNLNYTFKRGMLYVLVGPSGSGKSTILHLIASVLPPTSGKIIYQKGKVLKEETTLILQQPYFYGDLSVVDNIRLISLFNKTAGKKVLKTLAAEFGISHILKRKVRVCSGGEKARANLVRGIFENKDILLIDEPTAHLDERNSLLVAKALSEVAKTKICIVTTHEPELFTAANVVRLYLRNGTLSHA